MSRLRTDYAVQLGCQPVTTDAIVHDQRYREVPVGELEPHPQNPRRGDRRRIAQSIAANGFYGAVVVQAVRDDDPERTLPRIIVGEHRWRELVEAGAESVPVIEVSVTDEQAKAIMLMDNRSVEHSVDDPATLVEVLSEMDKETMRAAGYIDADLQDLIARLEKASENAAPPDEFPTFSPDDMTFDHTCPRCGYEW